VGKSKKQKEGFLRELFPFLSYNTPEEGNIMTKDLERFIQYCEVDTQSDDTSSSTPSAMKELNLSKLLMKQLAEMGIKSTLDQYGRVYAKLEGEKGLAPIGFNSHVDTALEVTDTNCKPRLIEAYDGGVIKLNDTYSMSPDDFPRLATYKGSDLVVTSGNTLLGADDKAGLAIIMAALAHYVAHPEEKHHTICILFTPDEEIGRGPEHFDAKKFGAEYAYTFDGAEPDIIEDENFNAAHADIKIEGVSIHPGEAKGKLVNAIRVAEEFDMALDPKAKPEYTEKREGFNHVLAINGTAEHIEMHYIIRNHDRSLLEQQKAQFQAIAQNLSHKYPKAKIELTLGDDYRNMHEVFDKQPEAVKHADEIYAQLGIKARHEPIRGGTDGATFSFHGCPTPNLGTGSYNHHGRFEYLSVKDFETMIKIAIAIVKA
jgi:tripeptide aminopeptidase